MGTRIVFKIRHRGFDLFLDPARGFQQEGKEWSSLKAARVEFDAGGYAAEDCEVAAYAVMSPAGYRKGKKVRSKIIGDLHHTKYSEEEREMVKWNKFEEVGPSPGDLVLVYHALYGMHLMRFRVVTSGGVLDERVEGYDENNYLDDSGIEWTHWIRTPEPPR